MVIGPGLIMPKKKQEKRVPLKLLLVSYESRVSIFRIVWRFAARATYLALSPLAHANNLLAGLSIMTDWL